MPTDEVLPPPMEFSAAASFNAADFVRSDCNAEACDAVLLEDGWPDGRLILTGPARCGKTHLAHIWSQAAKARILSCGDLAEPGIAAAARGAAAAVLNADRSAGNSEQEAGLFHLCNAAAESGGLLLLTSRRDPALWTVRLADLKSRAQGSRCVSVGSPDDRMLRALIIKLAADRQISVAPNVADYILPRMERTFEAAEALVAEIDRRCLAKGRGISRTAAAESLAALNSTTVRKEND